MIWYVDCLAYDKKAFVGFFFPKMPTILNTNNASNK